MGIFVAVRAQAVFDENDAGLLGVSSQINSVADCEGEPKLSLSPLSAD